MEWLADGTAIVKDFVLIGRENGTNGTATTGTGSGSGSNGTTNPSGPIASVFTGGAGAFPTNSGSMLMLVGALLVAFLAL